jgi:hypothetical protein
MDINRNNYEEYFLDYWENRLVSAEKESLMLFLSQNTDLEDEFWSFENVLLAPENDIVINGKSAFKKPEVVNFSDISESNYQHYFVSFIENQLSREEISSVNEFLTLNPILNKELELFTKTILKPEISVVFNAKGNLKKHETVKFDFRKALYYSMSAAASVAVLIFVYFILNTGVSEKSQVVRLIHEKKIDNYRPVKEINNNKENYKAYYYNNKIENKQHKKVVVKTENNYQIDEMALLQPLNVTSNQIALNVDLIGDLSHSENIANCIIYLKENTDVRYFVKKKAYQENNTDFARKKFTFWDIAVTGVKGYNVFASKKVDFKKETDKDGKVVYIAFGEKFGYSRTKH